MSNKKVIFVGAGPGDPELITLKGIKAIQNADVVIYAGSLVPRKILEDHAKAPPETWYNSAKMNLEEIISLIERSVSENKRVVRVHTGDPSIYGAIQEQIAELEKRGIDVEIIPGVSSAFAAAAALKMEYTIPEQSQTVILTRLAGKTPVPEREDLEALAAHGASMVIFLSAAMVEKVQEKLLKHYPPETWVAIAYRVSWPDEQLIRCQLRDLPDIMKSRGIKKQALIIISPGLTDNQISPAPHSRLYSKHFEHGERKSKGSK